MSADGDKEPLSRADRIALRISVIQTVLAVTGFVVGAIALYAALNEADAVRKQLQASVWPFVKLQDVNYDAPGDKRFEIMVGNRGIGPARIKTVSVTIDGEPQTNWRDMIRPLADGAGFGTTNFLVEGTVLAPAEDITMIGLSAEFSSPELVDAFRELVGSGRVNMEICYCSVFDECWNLNAREGDTNPVKQCPEPAPESSF